MKTLGRILAAAAFGLALAPADAAVQQITVAGASQNYTFAGTADGSGNLYPLTELCGNAASATPGALAAECAIVNASGQLLTLDSQSGAWNITNITGTVSLPTGAAISALQPAINGDGGAQVHVQNTNANGQAADANSSPVVLPADQVTVDPCALKAKTNLAISTNATALTQIVAASGSTKIYICSIALIAPAATAFNLNTGTGTNCGSSTAALIGSTTAANGMSLAANGGFTLGNGMGTVAVTASSSELCTLQSNAVQVSGNLTYVQQ